MREIKFRAWNTLNKNMIIQPPLVYHLGVLHYGYITNLGYEHFEGFPIMQSTGLTDKSGKEIYEGDIGRVKLNNEKILNGVVEWITDTYYWKNKHNVYPLGEVKHELEIIGNIYENPELMEQEK